VSSYSRYTFLTVLSSHGYNIKREGLLYLQYPTSDRRPTNADVIVLSIRTTTEPDIVVAGAIIPVSRIRRFPFTFRINELNAIPSQLQQQPKSSTTVLLPSDVWKEVLARNDLLVQAIVCSDDTIRQNFDGSTIPKRSTVQQRKHSDTRIYDILNQCQATSSLSSSSTPSSPLSARGIAKLIQYTSDDSSGSNTAITTKKSDLIRIRAPVSLPLG
jgi:hypothetical protein